MNVRPASFRDLGRIEQLYRDHAVLEEEQGTAPVLSADIPVPQRTLLRLWSSLSKTLSSLVPYAEQEDVLFVAEDSDGHIVGFIQAQAIPGRPRSWQILNLCTAAGPATFSRESLLSALCMRGSEHGVNRFHVRLPLDHPLVSVFIEQGFAQYATEQILYRDDSAAAPRLASAAPLPLRLARRDDLGGIYLLYLRTTPSTIANLEGASQKAWQSSFQGGWPARMGRDDVRHYVAERPGITAWAGLRPASSARPTLLALMCESHDPDFREEVITAALAQTPPGPLSCVLRHYDSELIRALQARGFEVYGSQLLLVRDLAAKVRLRAVRTKKKPVLVHAGVTQSVDVPMTPATAIRRTRSSPT
ncbi:MAG: hypothetical protein NVSMB29_00460 [Candidatus Dormibacteria bacterium]